MRSDSSFHSALQPFIIITLTMSELYPISTCVTDIFIVISEILPAVLLLEGGAWEG